jgi:hypothetical protein
MRVIGEMIRIQAAAWHTRSALSADRFSNTTGAARERVLRRSVIHSTYKPYGGKPMRTHANRGRFFEEYLQHLHARYRDQGRARIDFIPTPTRPHNDRNGVSWAPVYKGIVDFVGVLTGGRFVAFDAKGTRNTRSWRVKTSRRSP